MTVTHEQAKEMANVPPSELATKFASEILKHVVESAPERANIVDVSDALMVAVIGGMLMHPTKDTFGLTDAELCMYLRARFDVLSSRSEAVAPTARKAADQKKWH